MRRGNARKSAQMRSSIGNALGNDGSIGIFSATEEGCEENSLLALPNRLTGNGPAYECRKSTSVQLRVVSLDSVYGGKRSFDPHLADGEVQRGTPQWISTMWKGTFSARYGRTGELHHREAGLRRR